MMKNRKESIIENNNLWPDDLIPIERIETPAAILKEQGQQLMGITHGKITSDVSTRQELGRIVHTFYLVVPSLNNYRYGLFRIVHPVHLFPVVIYFDAEISEKGLVADASYTEAMKIINEYTGANSWAECQDMNTFKRDLKVLLSSSTTKRVIQSLYSQIDF